MQPTIHVLTLGVCDLQRSKAFYTTLGFTPVHATANICFFALHGTWLSLFPWENLAKDIGICSQGDGFRGVTLAHMVPEEADVLPLLQAAQDAGATLVKPGQRASWGGFSGYFSDPDQHLWEVVFNPFFQAGPAPS